ncbi:MAG TPA: hypothetical protein PLR43_06670, partial [Syntrophales bacterium]|nr:hypothetical protein [Syntrophales bacterium]
FVLFPEGREGRLVEGEDPFGDFIEGFFYHDGSVKNILCGRAVRFPSRRRTVRLAPFHDFRALCPGRFFRSRGKGASDRFPRNR